MEQRPSRASIDADASLSSLRYPHSSSGTFSNTIMAGLEGLASVIYHEKQQQGSMLCAQHALNSLLQGPYFTAPDLSEIARKLDRLEDQYHTEGRQGSSRNMDDTGFFSVQVMEEALEVWGLNLLRWRSNAMRPYQDRAHTQLAFILNLGEHWFTLRRFGPASANIDEDPGQGHWFNLNSFLSAPEWVGKLYLGMVLQQAETEGYSVFVVTQIDPSKPLALSRTEADDIAATLPEPESATLVNISNVTKHSQDTPQADVGASGRGSLPNESDDVDDIDGVEDDDYELQAALQASLASQEGYGSPFYDTGTVIPTETPALASASSSRTYSHVASESSLSRTSSQSPQLNSPPDHAELDPVAASMERNRLMLQRMRQQQEFAQRELWSMADLDPEEQAAQEARRQERLRQEEEEAEELRKAIEESEAMAREWSERQTGTSKAAEAPSLSSSSMDTAAQVPSFEYSSSEHRNYDDEDAELQAALRASLENVPPGWQQPAILQPPPARLPAPHASTAQRVPVASKQQEPQDMDVDGDEEWHSDSEHSDVDGTSSGKTGSSPAEQTGAAPSLAEIRQARLARFNSGNKTED
ncbi:hypothetical protein NP233_g1338 [Leucocoprinus birnbaumii]|uniref:ubiquitinyl hydrolase 1 n=1 Tax=Leucocoprinus birnbaumii TaxID=56174 RepID=A0AAD5W182_9AGAR|nr:hypothetical protein NP233_g1338 [Leucocoprinus birnbaumii]